MAPETAPSRSSTHGPDPEELRLCLSGGHAFEFYWEQVSLMATGEQDLGLLLCCARVVETRAQGMQLARHIERRIEQSWEGADGQDLAFLGVLQGYILHQIGRPYGEIQGSIAQSVEFLANIFAPRDEDRPSPPYKIDVPKLMLFDYGLKMCGADQEDRKTRVLDLLLTHLPSPGNNAMCETVVQKCLKWSIEQLSSPSARAFSPSILEVPARGLSDVSVWKAVVHLFCFLLFRYVSDPDAAASWSNRVNTALRISACDLLATLSSLILAGPLPLSDLDHLCADSAALATEAAERAARLDAAQDRHELLVFFLFEYMWFTFPEGHSAEQRRFLGEVCDRAVELRGTFVEGGEGGLEFLKVDMLE